MNKILMVLEFMFGCWHGNLSRPFTLSGWTYEVCLSCGRKFAYDRAEFSCGRNAASEFARHENSSDTGPATLARRNAQPKTLDIEARGEVPGLNRLRLGLIRCRGSAGIGIQ